MSASLIPQNRTNQKPRARVQFAPAARGGQAWLIMLLALIEISLFSAPRFVYAKRTLTEENRIDLIRGLDREVAVAKVALPLGKHGLFIDSTGAIKQTEARKELSANGVAVAPGMPVEITKMTFKPEGILFEINGGGKKRGKWYQHLEIGIGGPTQPIGPQNTNPVQAQGSFITLLFPKNADEKLTVDHAKQLLNAALDFNRHSPTVLYSPAVPPKFKEAIKNHEVVVGMDRDAVLSARGTPDRKVRDIKDGEVVKEDWIYGTPPHVLFVTFDGDTVIEVHQY